MPEGSRKCPRCGKEAYWCSILLNKVTGAIDDCSEMDDKYDWPYDFEEGDWISCDHCGYSYDSFDDENGSESDVSCEEEIYKNTSAKTSSQCKDN